MGVGVIVYFWYWGLGYVYSGGIEVFWEKKLGRLFWGWGWKINWVLDW